MIFVVKSHTAEKTTKLVVLARNRFFGAIPPLLQGLRRLRPLAAAAYGGAVRALSNVHVPAHRTGAQSAKNKRKRLPPSPRGHRRVPPPASSSSAPPLQETQVRLLRGRKGQQGSCCLSATDRGFGDPIAAEPFSYYCSFLRIQRWTL